MSLQKYFRKVLPTKDIISIFTENGRRVLGEVKHFKGKDEFQEEFENEKGTL